jgi:hypothetical protein
LETVSPSPVAVTVNAVVVTGDVALAASVSVAVVVAVPGAGVKVVLLQDGVTVVGSPLIVKVTGPWKEPPVEKVNRSVVLVPCATGCVAKAGEKVSVGAVWETLKARPPVAE